MDFTPEDLQALVERDPALAHALLLQLEKDTEDDGGEPRYMVDLHPKQHRFVIDDSPKKTALCSRRAGKSYGDAACLLRRGEMFPNERSVYVALSRATGRMIMWNALEKIERQYKLGLRFRERDNQLYVIMPNGHFIWIAGCKDSSEIDKFRGDYYATVVIDEAASFGAYLKSLIEDVFEPALLDLQGQLIMSGTPGPIPAGPFYWATTGESEGVQGWAKWSAHEWTILDNPYIPHAAEWLAKKRKENGWDESHPTYKREWLGLWVKDPGALVYPFDQRNIFHTLPDGEWRHTIGIDVGYTESSAFVVGAYQPGVPPIFIREAFKKEKLIPSAVAAIAENLMQKYSTRRVVVDAGGFGKGYHEEMVQRYGIPAEPAKKNRKRAYIEVVRGELLAGNIRVHPGKAGCLLDEWQRLVWDEKREAPDNRFEDHAADGALYLIRDIHTGNRPELEEPTLTREQYEQARMEAFKRELGRQIAAKGRKRLSRADVRAIVRGL